MAPSRSVDLSVPVADGAFPVGPATDPLPLCKEGGEGTLRSTFERVAIPPELLVTSPARRAVTLATPFVWLAGYFVFALAGLWPLAVVCAMGLSFTSYGSTSHDLIHANLGLSPARNRAWLTVLETLCLRSATAYRHTHLHHHRRFPHEDDVEASGSTTFPGALLSGPVAQVRNWLWAYRRFPRDRRALVLEATAVLALVAVAVALRELTLAPLVHVGLMVAGSWVFPLVTVWLVHDPAGRGPLEQTRLFRGALLDRLFFSHLYHLEHHLYPAVPHHQWKALAAHLDPFFAAQGLVPVTTLRELITR